MTNRRLALLIGVMTFHLFTGGDCTENCPTLAGCLIDLGLVSLSKGGAERASAPPQATPGAGAAANPAPGDVLVIGGATTNRKKAVLEFFDPATRIFKNAGIAGGSSGFGAVEFDAGILSGQILVAGGAVGTAKISGKGVMTFAVSVPTTSQLYKLSSDSVTATGGLNDGRFFATTTLLSDGTVLIAGGFDKSGKPLASAEIYDPATGRFSLTGSMVSPRALHTATLLADGAVLLVGGVNDLTGHIYGTAELYDPTHGRFTATAGALPRGVAGHTATLLATGKVLIAGGFNSVVLGAEAVYNTTNTSLLYTPASQQFVATGNMIDTPTMHSATLLPNGDVLIAGGYSGAAYWEDESKLQGNVDSGVLDSAEIYNPVTGTFTCIDGATKVLTCKPSMANARAGHSATIFASGPLAGEVLLAGGMGAKASTVNRQNPPSALASAELFDPVSNKFTATGSMVSQHAFHSALLLH